jgi:DNA-binding PadR family transcriptional regulator
MTSQVNWALLGLVILRPGHGYDLMQRFERTYGEVLRLSSYSQIYGALDELEGRGLIEEITKPGATRRGTSRQPRVPYQATEEGRRSYRERMIEQAGEDRRQLELFVRQLAAFEREPDVASEILDHHETALMREGRQDRCRQEGLADRLLYEARQLAMEGRLMWIEFARDEFGRRKAGRT